MLMGTAMEIWHLGVTICFQFGKTMYRWRRPHQGSAVTTILALHLFFPEILRWGKCLEKDDMVWNHSGNKNEEYKSLITWILWISLLQSDIDKSILSSERESISAFQ